MPANATLTVGEITRHIRNLLEQDPGLRSVAVEGEISNLTRHASGHVYFTLKDEEAQLSCAMFKGNAMRYMNRMPKHGDRIIVRGDINLYPPQGRYQLIATAFEFTGEGELHRRFLELKEKLEREGLFAPGRKRSLPRIPNVVGVVTSPTGAVIRDIANTLRRRFPAVKLLLSPASVQGEQAVPTLLRALHLLNRRSDVDVIILARGGGSLEDLWCFNDERLARAIAESRLPVITGIGHETDFTIADFVADVRASTPTAAAEQVTPDKRDILRYLGEQSKNLQRNLTHFIDFRRQLLDDYENRMTLQVERIFGTVRRELEDVQSELIGIVEWQLNDLRHELESLWGSMNSGIRTQVQQTRHELQLLEMKLQTLDLRETLKRGFSITMKGNQRITDARQLEKGDEIETHFATGSAIARVEETKQED